MMRWLALAFAALMFAEQAPWRVVAGCALAGAVFL